MAERYDYIITKNNDFSAGYLCCTLKNNAHEPTLFHNPRIIRVLEGEALLQIDKKAYCIKPGDVIPLNNLTPRRFVNVFTPEIRFDLFAFSPLVLKNESTCLSLFYCLPNSFDPIIPQKTETAEELHMLLDILKNKFYTYTPNGADYDVILSLIVTVALNIISINEKQNAVPALHEKSANNATLSLVVKAIEYIFNHISEPLKVSEVARALHVSREYLSRVFHRFVGHTAVDFINHCKIERVIYLIQNGNHSILDAALESGFNSVSGFYSAFHSVHGTSPRRFFEKNK